MKKLFFIFSLLFLFCFANAQSDIYLSLSSLGKKFSIGIEPFLPAGKNPESSKYASAIRGVIENDLILSRYFNVIMGNFTGKNLDDKISAWEEYGASVLFTASVEVENKGSHINVQIKMYDTVSKKLIWETVYRSQNKDAFRDIAHEISNEIVRRFTGEEGIALSKIAFVNNGTRFKELYVIDYDGHNLRRLTRDARLNLLPKWSPDGDQIIYTSYLFNNPDLFSINIVDNKRAVVSKYQGLNSAGTFSPNGQTILLTLSRGLFPNLYLLDKNGRLVQRMTEGAFIDTSPSFAPNGKEIVFISDRIGYPQMYIMNVEGRNIRRLPTNGHCDSPAWSPRGDKIAFTMRQKKGRFDLYVYDLKSSKITRLTNGQGDNENPVWSPDGRFLAFSSSRGGRWEIYVMAIDGSGTRKVAEIQGNSYTPAWSPNIKVKESGK
jgi:TolB protein